MIRAVALSALALSLAACSKPAPSPEPSATPADVATTSAPQPVPSATAAPISEKAIPEAMRGEWGINAADCDTASGAAKGNMMVESDSLKFYESVARLGTIETVTADTLRAQFAFSGEGQTWQQGVSLTLSDGGKVLTRKDSGPDALPEPLIYQRCPA